MTLCVLAVLVLISMGKQSCAYSIGIYETMLFNTVTRRLIAVRIWDRKPLNQSERLEACHMLSCTFNTSAVLQLIGCLSHSVPALHGRFCANIPFLLLSSPNPPVYIISESFLASLNLEAQHVDSDLAAVQDPASIKEWLTRPPTSKQDPAFI